MPDFAIENELRTDGYYPIAGIDEAGRGPLAGPVVAAAAILPEGFVADGLNDSKKLSPSRREKLHALMTSEHSGVVWSLARVDPKVIDDINILKGHSPGDVTGGRVFIREAGDEPDRRPADYRFPLFVSCYCKGGQPKHVNRRSECACKS